MCMGGCGKANSYTPKKVSATIRQTTQQAKVIKGWAGMGGSNRGSASFGQPKVRMSFGKR